ncbi:MAG: LicD family protein [Methanobrevibacter sp.]|uniref:LicD family protein n=1 Tax=Methanobrevibacter sp. TaxID=66852 RepID=UPI0025CBB6C9|nr:LicD family protein [Methanobrevibacter sp.]MBQ6098516.1 LicD family protein [Methanobrevibacter sp.]
MKFTDYDLETLNKLQNMELMILKDFIKICAENNLKYYMYGGSLIGVIRHEGFIPWDDDIDVIMFREDYEKFKEIFLSSHSEKYELLSDETYDDYFFLFSKIILKGTKFEEWWVDQVSFSVGINIDIFVLDFLSDNDLICSFQLNSTRFLRRLLAISSIKLVDYPQPTQFVSNVTHYIFDFLKVKPSLIINICLKLVNRQKNTNRVTDITTRRPQIYNVDDYGTGIKMNFEGIDVNVPENYHEILKQIYGDYMKLPPEDERFNHITEQLSFGDY